MVAKVNVSNKAKHLKEYFQAISHLENLEEKLGMA